MSQEKLVLKITGPDGTTQTRALEEAERLLIGSGEKAALRLEDAEVSTLHSMVKVDQGEVTVIDLGSATGTRVAGRPIQGATRLEPGAILEIGRMRIELAALAAPIVVPEASPGLATRLLEESLPPGEAPASDARQLEVAMLWGDSLLDVRHYRAEQVVRIGSQRSNDFHLDGAGESFELARCGDESCMLSFPPGAGVRWRGGAAKSTTTLELNDRVQMSLGTVSFVARWVRPPAQAKAATRGRDFNFAKVLTTSVMVFVVTLPALSVAVATNVCVPSTRLVALYV